MKSRKSHFRQVPYHAYSTYIQTSNQAIRGQKPIKKEQTTPKPRKLYKKMKIFHKNMCKKGIRLPPPKSHNVLIGSQGTTTKNKKHKIDKPNKTQMNTNKCINSKDNLT